MFPITSINKYLFVNEYFCTQRHPRKDTTGILLRGQVPGKLTGCKDEFPAWFKNLQESSSYNKVQLPASENQLHSCFTQWNLWQVLLYFTHWSEG